MSSDIADLKALGATTVIPTAYAPEVLERFANRFPGTPYEVEIDCPEFTSMCPKTGQPDFAAIKIAYSPADWLVESKSLKLYLFSYRSKGEFHEDCVNSIARDLFALLTPRWIEVRGVFRPRGGISIYPRVRLEGVAR